MAKTAAERKRDERDRKRGIGLNKVELWLLKEDIPTAKKLEEKSKKKANKA